VRQVYLSKGGTEDIMSNEFFLSRWSEMVKQRGEEMIADRIQLPTGQKDRDEDVVVMEDQTLRGSKAVDRCAPDTSEYWDSFAAQQVRQYIKLAVEPRSSNGVANELKNSALNSDFMGEDNKSIVAIVMDIDLLLESATRPLDRKPVPDQANISKLVAGVFAERTNNPGESERPVPRDGDVIFLCDGGRDVARTALRRP
jgi:hypothetical protein